mgnify:CR=1 FL=1
MGRALDVDKRQDEFDRRLKKVEDTLMKLDGMVSTTVKHIDLHESTKEVLAETPKTTKKDKKDTASA